MRNLWTDPTTLAVTCGRGVVPYLKQELINLGYEILGENDTMVGIRANNACRDILRLNLSLRTAQRVLWPFVQDVKCRNLDDLYDLAVYAPWEQVLDIDQPFYVNNATRNVESVVDSRMPTLKLKDAIVDRMRARCGRRPNVGDTVSVKVEADGKALFERPVPLRNAMRIVRAAIEDWLNEIPPEKDRADILIEIDGYDLMSGSLYLPKLDLMVLKKRFERTFASRLEGGTPAAAVFLWWEGTHAKIYLDTSGTVLSRRGYRKEGWVAPMQEALAAATVMATGWDRKVPFLVPFSGSGTPAIEAALMARNILPGIFRADFAFMHLKGWKNIIPGEKVSTPSVRKRFGATPQEIWRDLLAQARAAEVDADDPRLPKIIGVDWEGKAVDIAAANAAAAGVAKNIAFFEDDFTDTPIPQQPGVIFMNPPYGERLEDEDSLMPLYEGIGTWLRGLPADWKAWVITSSKPLSLKIRLTTSEILPFKNGPLDCRFISYDIHGPIPELPEEEVSAPVDAVDETASEADVDADAPTTPVVAASVESAATAEDALHA